MPTADQIHFNGLSPQVAELLAILAEECGEVVQRVGKILRHGIRVNPCSQLDLETGKMNTHHLEDELTDLYAIVMILGRVGVVCEGRIIDAIPQKLERLTRPEMLHHSVEAVRRLAAVI